jgi:hypothetical protein
MFKKKFSNIKNLFIFLLLILLIIFLIYLFFKSISKNNLFNSIEYFGGEGESAAFDIVGYKKWTFPKSDGKWYTVTKNGYKMNFADTGMNTDSKKLSILFIYNCLEKSDRWRNIFHFTNDNQNYNMGSRVPALWITPDYTNTFHFTFSTSSNNNEILETTKNLMPFDIPLFVGFVLDENIARIYINGILVIEQSYNNIQKRNKDTILYIGDPWYESDILIKNFTLYDSALTIDDIKNVYNSLESSIVKNGNKGPNGPKGAEGPMGLTGPKGDKGMKGDKGDTGPIGIQGPPSSIQVIDTL